MSHYYLNFNDWYLWDEPDDDVEPCQIPLYVDLEVPYETPESEETVKAPRIIIIDI